MRAISLAVGAVAAAISLFACAPKAPSGGSAGGVDARAPAPTRGPAAVDAARLRAADSEPGQWMSYGRNYEEQHYSPLDQITTANVQNLGLAWYADIPLNRGQEATPLFVDGVLYLGRVEQRVRVRREDGRATLAYDPQGAARVAVNVCCGEVNRGVAAWNGKIYVGTLDGRLVALDAATGKEVWSTLTIDRTQRYSITGALRVVKGRVLIGNWRRRVRRARLRHPRTTRRRASWRGASTPSRATRRDGFENDGDGDGRARPGTASGGSSAAAARRGTRSSTTPNPISSTSAPATAARGTRALAAPAAGDNLFLASIVALDADTG